MSNPFALSSCVPSGLLRPVSTLIVLAMITAMVVAIFGRGQIDDEGEHLHAAYLIGRWGERPHVDFFQHHPNLLWIVLSPIFRFGPTSATVAVFAGRAIVVLALLATWLGLARIARRIDARTTALANGGALVLAFTGVVYPEALSLRPETIALPLLVWGWSYAQGKHAFAAFGGGCLAGMACEAAPRFLCVMAIFAIPPLMNRGRLAWKDLASGLAGWAVGFAGTAIMTGQTASETLFNIQFSAMLQKIGQGNPMQLPSMAGVLLFLFVLVRSALPVEFRTSRDYRAWEAVAWLVLVAGALSAWPFLYGQALVPLVAVVMIMMAHAEGAFGRVVFTGSVVMNLAAVVTVVSAAVALCAGTTVFSNLKDRESLAAAMQPGDSILMRSRLHPIVVKDASFYPVLLMDSRRRTTRAIQAARTRWNLPAIDYAKDIQKNRPRLLDSAYVFEVNTDNAPNFLPWLEANYVQVSRLLLVRKDAIKHDGENAESANGTPVDDR